jgi:type IV pilus assembly protein PilX
VRKSARERGVVLFIVLIVLVAMSMAAISMFRAADTGSMIAGNLAFKQSALLSADVAVEQARGWLNGNPNSLSFDNGAQGYYSTRQESLDILGIRTPSDPKDDVDWDGKNKDAIVKAFMLPVDPVTGNQVSYIVHRLCELPGPSNAALQSCAVSWRNASGSTNAECSYQNCALLDTSSAYYRITARVEGPRNTVSFVQATILP